MCLPTCILLAMTPEAKDAPSTVGPQPGTRTATGGRRLRALHALLLVALGGWLLVRALQTLLPDARLPASLAFAGASKGGWALGALLVGVWLLVIAPALPNGRAWAWANAAVAALATLALVAVSWALGSEGDWLGVLLSLATAVVLAAPSARELYLQ